MPSSVVHKMEYDAESATLRITFVSGLIYVYKNVPEAVYISMKHSGSKGAYLNQHIKGKYEYEKLSE